MGSKDVKRELALPNAASGSSNNFHICSFTQSFVSPAIPRIAKLKSFALPASGLQRHLWPLLSAHHSQQVS